MQKMTQIIKNILLAFVLISIGFAMGRHSVSSKSPEAESTGESFLVRVYYLHAAIRCTTCNTIEKMTLDFLKKQYSQAMAEGKIEFREVNFQENKTLAKKFDVLASCVVVAQVKAGKITAFKRLDKVWTLYEDPPEFNAYIDNAIQTYLTERKKKK